MVQHKHDLREQEEQIIFLVHTSTGRQVDLPACPSVIEWLFVFYVGSHEAPLVVACIETISKVPTIHVACPGDVYWSTYKNMDDSHLRQDPHRPIKFTLIVDVALLGKRAVCVDYNGRILIFDITEMAWRTACSLCWSERDAHFLVASGVEEVVLISCHRCGARFCGFKFFKLDTEALEWSPLDDAELDGSSWFLYRGRSFCMKQEGKRNIYTFSPNQWGGLTQIDAASLRKRKIAHGMSRPSAEKSVTNIYEHNLADGVVRKVLPTSIVTEARHWVQSDVFGGPFL